MTNGRICNYLIFDIVKLATLVKGNPKVPLSITTTPRCRGGHCSIPRIAPLYPWSSPYSAECLTRRHQVPFFESLKGLDLGLNPGLLDHWRILYSLGQKLLNLVYNEIFFHYPKKKYSNAYRKWSKLRSISSDEVSG